MSTILQDIFRDHYEELLYITHPRPAVIENVDRMLNCGDPSFGGAMYFCKCGFLKFVPFRCHSRFCPTCGNMYSIDRTTAMSFRLIDCTHRHCVFTIPQELRHFFLDDRSLLNCLFSAVKTVLLALFHKENKSKRFTPGFVLVLHTFGRSLQWNPHIHCVISETAIAIDGSHRKFKHFNYTFLRHSFCTVLLNLLEKKIGPSFKKDKALIYKFHQNGFYIYAKPNQCDVKQISSYIGRYLGRPAIATKRIDSYDGERVTFHYNRHGDEKYIVETIPALEFMERLVQHIPEKHFKMIRYYGIYSFSMKGVYKTLRRAVQPDKRRVLASFNKWRLSILSAFGYDPILCPKCNSSMEVLEIYYNHKPVSLQDLYRKARISHGIREGPSFLLS